MVKNLLFQIGNNYMKIQKFKIYILIGIQLFIHKEKNYIFKYLLNFKF